MTDNKRFRSVALIAVLVVATVAGAGALVGGAVAADADSGDGDDSMANATTLDVGTSVNGTVESSEDADWYRVNVSENRLFFATIAGHEVSDDKYATERDVRVNLYGPDGEYITGRQTNLLTYGYGAGYSFAMQVDEPGTYYLEVNGSYDDTYEGKQGYTLRTSDMEQDPNEPNDRSENATALEADSSISSYTYGFDTDIYTVDLEAGETVTVNYTETSDVDTGHIASVRAPNGSSVTKNDRGGDENLTFTADESGSYIIYIGSGADYGTVDTTDINTYDLTVEVADDDVDSAPTDDGGDSNADDGDDSGATDDTDTGADDSDDAGSDDDSNTPDVDDGC